MLDATKESCENMQQWEEGKFTCPPTGISIHRKVNLQDTEVSEEICDKFHDLCSRCPQVFSSHSEDFGHTDLVTMDTEMGNSLAISQKPYNLSRKHTVWVQKELETLKKQGSLLKVFLLGLVSQ